MEHLTETRENEINTQDARLIFLTSDEVEVVEKKQLLYLAQLMFPTINLGEKGNGSGFVKPKIYLGNDRKLWWYLEPQAAQASRTLRHDIIYQFIIAQDLMCLRKMLSLLKLT